MGFISNFYADEMNILTETEKNGIGHFPQTENAILRNGKSLALLQDGGEGPVGTDVRSLPFFILTINFIF